MDIPKNLTDRLREKKVIPFVGAGVSMAVQDKDTGQRLFPSWKELLERAANRLDEERDTVHATLVRALLQLNNPEEYLEAAKRARQGLVGILWSNFLKEQFDVSPERASDESLVLPKAIWELGSRLIITTNYDRVLHWTCPQLNQLNPWDIQASAEQVAALSRGLQRPVVWHLHGSIDNAANIILTPDGYRRLYPEGPEQERRYHAALETLRQLLTTHTFLFIGYSLDDRHFGLQLQGLNEIFQGHTETHYVLVHAADVDRVKKLNLPVVPVPFEDFGEPLLKLVQHLGSIAAEKEADAGIKESLLERGYGSIRVASYDPARSVFYVPYRSKGDQVIGREETIQAVREQLTKGRRTAIGQAVMFEGLGGLGKTQLAVEYAHRYRDEYSNGVIWLTADQDIDAQLTDLAEKAQWIAPESEHKYKLEIALRRLRTYSDCLIIFDNVESVSDIKPYLPEPEANPHILITSRTEQPGFTPVPVDLLNSELSLKLLLQEAGRKQEPVGEDEWKAAREIAADLDGLPLALELAGAYIRYRRIQWQKYRDLLRRNLKAALPGKFLEGSFTQHDKDIYSTLKINEEVLAEEPRLREILDLLTWSGSASMGISLMCALLNVDDAAELTNALGLGTVLRLLQKNPDAESYAIHRLVREVRREEIPLQGCEDWVKDICQQMGDWFQARRIDFRHLSAFEAEIDHLREWQQHALKYVPEYASRLIWLQTYPSYHRGNYRESKEWLNKAWEVFEQVSVNDLELKSNLLNDFGFIYSALGDNKSALEYNRQALAIRLELFGERHPDTARSFDSVGASYGHLGDHKRALEYHEKALAIQLKLFGERHPDTARSFNNVGVSYSDLGNYKRASEYVEKALVLRLELFGESHPYTARSFDNVGGSYNDLGDHKRALEYKQKALSLKRALLGDQHPDTVFSVDSVAYSLSKLNRGFEALRLVDEWLNKIQKDHVHYNPLQERKQKILRKLPGFRAEPVNKRKGKKKKRR